MLMKLLLNIDVIYLQQRINRRKKDNLMSFLLGFEYPHQFDVID